MEYMVSVQEIHIHSRETRTRNKQIPTRRIHTGMDDPRKDHIDTKAPKQRNRIKQLKTNNLSTDDVENINGTKKRRNLLLANKPQIVPWGI